MMHKIKFIHAADLHLDSPFMGLNNLDEKLFKHVKESTFIALNNLVNQAINHQVDFILLVGDLFDNNKQSLKAQVKLKTAFEKLNDHNIMVYLSYGNHDFLLGNDYPIEYPPNVHVFDSETVKHAHFYKNEEIIANIYGFSYETRSVTNNKVAEYKKLSNQALFNIGMLHGSAEAATGHANYAPFKISELRAVNFDYWALGHIHTREILSDEPYIVYPGNIQGRHRNESGSKGCYIVEMTETNTALEYISLATLNFETITINLTESDTIHTMKDKINDLITDFGNIQLIYLVIDSSSAEITKWETEGRLDEVIQILNDVTKHYIYKYKINLHTHTFFENNYFFRQLLEHLEDHSAVEAMNDLLTHPQARRYHDLINFSEEEIKEEAKQILFSQFYNGGRKS